MRPAAAREGNAVRLVAASAALFFLIACWPILHGQVPPLGDYVNHLARMHVIAAGGRDPLLTRFYAVEWKLIPNLAMDIFVPPLIGAVGIYLAGKIFVLTAFALVLSGAHAIHWALFRRLSLGPSVAALFLYSEIASSGLLNYLFGIGLALWGIAVWIGLRSRHPALRGAVSAVFVAALFVCHLSALGLYGTALLGFEIWRWRAERPERRRLAAELAAFALPFLLVPALLAMGPLGADSGGLEWRLYSKGQGLWYIAKTYYHAYDAAVAAGFAACALWAWRRGIVRLHPAGWSILAVAVPLFIALPYAAMTAIGVDKRFPVGIVYVLCGLLAWEIEAPKLRRGFLAALAALLCLRVAGVEMAAYRLQLIVADFRRSLDLVPPGSKVMVAQSGDDIPFPDTLLALPCLAMIERSSLVSIAFSDPAEQVLVVKPHYRAFTGGFGDEPPSVGELIDPPRWSAYTHSSRIYWRQWRQDYDYLYVMSGADTPNPAPQSLIALYRAPHFQLYRIVR